MTTEAKQAIEELQKSWHDFRVKNDERINEIKSSATATADGLVTEAVEKLNADLDQKLGAVQDAIKAAEKRAEIAELAAKRAGNSSAEGGISPATIKQASAMLGRPVSEDEYLERREAIQAWFKGGDEALARKGLSVDSDPDGGYLVLPDTSGRSATFAYETSPMRQYASVQTIGTDALEGLYDIDEAGSGWVGERESRSETTTPELGKWRIPTHELYAEPRATQKVLDDAMLDVESWLADKVAMKFARAEATAFVTGDGELKPRGFTTYSAGTPVGTSTAGYRVIQQVYSGASAGFPSAGSGSADAFIDMIAAMKAPYRAGAVWAMNRSTMGAVRKLRDADDNYYWQPDFREGASGTILGFPVAEFNDMADIAANSLSIAFANFSVGYQIVDRIGVRVLRDPYTAKPEVKFYTTKRVGGDVVNFEAIKLMKFGAL